MIFSRAKISDAFRKYGLPVVVGSWLILVVCAFYSFMAGHQVVGLSDGHGHPFGQCFINFWSAAKLAATGHIGDIYNWDVFHAFEQNTAGATLIDYHYSYPPLTPLLTLPLAWFPYASAFIVWMFATWAAFYAVLRAARPPVNAFLLSWATPAFLINAAAGQNGMLTAALLGGGLVLLPKRPLIAGILFGLLCFKPQLGFLIPVALIAGKEWRTAIAAALTVVLLVAASLVVYGPEPWIGYMKMSQFLRHYVLEDNTAQSWQQFESIFVAARQVGAGITAAYAIQGLFALASVACIVKLWHGKASPDIRNAALVLGTFMATPYAMDYDLVIMVLVAVWLSHAYPHYKFAAASLLVMPFISSYVGISYGIGVGPLMLLPACLLVLSSCKTPRAVIAPTSSP